MRALPAFVVPAACSSWVRPRSVPLLIFLGTDREPSPVIEAVLLMPPETLARVALRVVPIVERESVRVRVLSPVIGADESARRESDRC